MLRPKTAMVRPKSGLNIRTQWPPAVSMRKKTVTGEDKEETPIATFHIPQLAANSGVTVTQKEFYYVHVHLSHRKRLRRWRFDVHIVDLSDADKSFVLRGLSVDRNNFLQFAPHGTEAECAVFSPLDSLPWVRGNYKCLLGRGLRICVDSTSPLSTRIVDTVIFFGKKADRTGFEGARGWKEVVRSPSELEKGKKRPSVHLDPPEEEAPATPIAVSPVKSYTIKTHSRWASPEREPLPKTGLKQMHSPVRCSVFGDGLDFSVAPEGSRRWGIGGDCSDHCIRPVRGRRPMSASAPTKRSIRHRKMLERAGEQQRERVKDALLFPDAKSYQKHPLFRRIHNVAVVGTGIGTAD